jgi:PAS domain S-box-containing protein
LLGVILVFHDVSDQRRVEETLKESEKKYRYLVEHAPTGIYEIDFVNLKLISVNDAMCQFTGYAKEEFLTINPLELLTERSQKDYLERMNRAFNGEKVPQMVELEIKAKDGRKFWTLLNARYKYANGKPVSAIPW